MKNHLERIVLAFCVGLFPYSQALAQGQPRVEVLGKSPVPAQIVSASLSRAEGKTVVSLACSVENKSEDILDGIAIGLYAFTPDGKGVSGQRWYSHVDVSPGASIDLNYELTAAVGSKDNRAILVLEGVYAGDKKWVVDLPAGAAKLYVMRGTYHLYLKKGSSAHVDGVSQGSASPLQIVNLNARSRNTQPFTKEECSLLLNAARTVNNRNRQDLAAILLTFLTTGFRISDVIGLRWRDLDLEGNRIIKRTEKRDKMVYLPIHPELRAELNRTFTRPGKPGDYVFQTKGGKCIQNLNKVLYGLFRRAGIEGGHAHRFRDTFAVRLLEQGASLYDVSKLLGITAPVAERHYTPYVAELRERGARLVSQIQIEPSIGGAA